MLLALAAGTAAIACARWTRPIAEGDAAVAEERWDRALEAYAVAEARFDAIPVSRQLLARDYDRLVTNQLLIYYRLERYDDVIEKAVRAPESVAPHFWSGLALFAKGRHQTEPDLQLGFLTRAEAELRRAVEATPWDWDTKYDFELVTRLSAALRKQPKLPPDQLMQILRPQPRAGARPGRHVG